MPNPVVTKSCSPCTAKPPPEASFVSSYFLLTLSIVILSFLSGIYLQTESSILLAGLMLYIIDIRSITIPRLKDTDLSFKLRHFCYIPFTHIILKLILFFQESSEESSEESSQELKKSEKILFNSEETLTVIVKKSGKQENIKKSDWNDIVTLGNEDLFEIIHSNNFFSDNNYKNTADLNITDKQKKFHLEVRAKNEKDSLKVVQKKELKENKSADIEDNHQSFMSLDTILEKETTDEVIKEKIEVDELMDEEKNSEVIRKKESKEVNKEETTTKYISPVDELLKLNELKEKGLLTEDEFKEQKKKLLKQ